MANDMAAIGFLSTWGLNLTKNSAAKCCSSAAEPPFPQSNILPLIDIWWTILSMISSIVKISLFKIFKASISLFFFKLKFFFF